MIYIMELLVYVPFKKKSINLCYMVKIIFFLIKKFDNFIETFWDRILVG